MQAFLIFVAAAAAHAALMPLPLKTVPGQGRLSAASGFEIVSRGCPEAITARFRSRLERQTGIFSSGAEGALSARSAHLEIACDGPAPDWPTLGENESYTLDVTPAGARLHAATATGALRGFETFAQLIAAGPDGFEVPAVHIEDRPRYPWRGLMLDVSRHWMPVEVIERNLEAMAAVKLNVFHWHLSDDQGFRVESKLFPRLQQSGSDGHFYTQPQIREIVEYARERGIRVIPEFDMPGHTSSWFAGMPELAAAPGPYKIERDFGIFAPVMNAASESTYTFLDAFIGEMAALFPDPVFHIGGDEVEDLHARTLQPGFNRRVEAILKKHGKTMAGWDEVFAPGLARDTVVQSWRGPAALAEIAKKGYRGILSYGYYLNYLQPAAQLYAVDPGDGILILGGEACLWAEYVSPETVDSRIWPRMAAIAERFWSPKNLTGAASMYQRLDDVSRWLEFTGIRHRGYELPMLDRLAGDRPVEPLRALRAACEAAGHDARTHARHYTSLTPLNRFVDAAPPENYAVRRLELAAGRLAAGQTPDDLALLRATFRAWVENDAQFQSTLDGDGFLAELAPLSQNLKSAGEIGLRALEFMESGSPAPADWAALQDQLLDRLAEPQAEIILAATRPVRVLVDAVAKHKTSVGQVRLPAARTAPRAHVR